MYPIADEWDRRLAAEGMPAELTDCADVGLTGLSTEDVLDVADQEDAARS